jgi:predicted nuclease of predicted toxin-antitoxin system
MSPALYMDHHVPRAITQGLRARGVDILTAYEDGSDQMSDPALLDRAAHLERVMVTQDQDLLVEAAKRQGAGTFFRGVICIRQTPINIGDCIRDLEIITKIGKPEDLFNLVEYLPLK